MRALAVATGIGLTVIAMGVTACTQQPPGAGHHHDDAPTVVASTDVWGSVASAVVGDHATVKSLVSGAAGDPHSFEATPADAAAITDASLVVYNGGGYDHWVDDVLANNAEIPAVDAYSLLNGDAGDHDEHADGDHADGEEHAHGAGANEHVFYDPNTAKAVADDIAEKLSNVDPDHADAYRANAATFGKRTAEILQAQQAIGKKYPGASVVATEPVAFYLLRDAGLTDRTPPTFASAIEEGDDPSPADVAAVLDLVNGKEVSALVVNKQTETPVTNQIQAAARTAGIPTIVVTETLPEGTDYVQWQLETAKDFDRQLGSAAKPKP